MTAKFQREKMSLGLIDVMSPLLEKHYREVAHYQDIPLDPNWNGYLDAQHLGALRVFTVRGQDNSLKGYALFFVRPNMHYRSSLQAAQDVLFLDPESRKAGVGTEFIAWCDQQLREEGVQAVFHHVKSKANFGPKILVPMGYEEIDVIYGRRLDR